MPPQQQRRDPSGDPSLNGIILDTVRQVQQSVDNLAGRFDGLADRFMPRTELTSRFEDSLRDRTELRAQFAAAKAAHDVDIAKVQGQVEKLKTDAEQAADQSRAEARTLERERIVGRRWQVGTVLSLLALLLTLVGILVALTH